MHFKIKQIVLWPRNKNVSPRIVDLSKPGLLVITGESRTGKSALIPIIDYCLASQKCPIPTGTIRDACSWFGVIVETANSDLLLARREPGVNYSTDDMFMLEASKILEPPDSIESKNTNRDAVKRKLNSLSGLTGFDFDISESGNSYLSPPSFRDLTAFMFQPQHIVANPYALFYKADSQDHRQKLQTIFPYVLGALTAELLAKQQELEQLNKELRRKRSELETARRVSEKWISDIKSKRVQAAELGLLSPMESDDAETLIAELRTMVATVHKKLGVTEQTIDSAMSQMSRVDHEERELSLRLTQLRQRLSMLLEIQKSATYYKEALTIQHERLRVSRWLHDRNMKGTCVVCGAEDHGRAIQLEKLVHALESIESESNNFSEVPAGFDREVSTTRRQIRELSESLGAIQDFRDQIMRASQVAEREHFSALAASRFIGNTEEALNLFSELGTDSKLQQDITVLQERVKELSDEIDSQSVRRRLQSALERVTILIAKITPHLDCEKPGEPVQLSLSDLTIKVSGKDGRQDFLWEIGSGSNWLSYHVATLVALQKYFVRLKRSVVPHVLIFDQPSQVYFPKTQSPSDRLTATLKDRDVESVRKIYKVLASFASNVPDCQVIVVDHADEDVWGGIPNISLVDRWRDGEALVPISWINQEMGVEGDDEQLHD